MSFNGSGTFNINSTGQPVVSGTVISSSVFNALTADLATGLSTCLTKDGQTTVTANIPMNSFKFTGLAAGTAATDSVRVGQLQAGSASVVTVAGTDTYTGTMSPSLAAYAAGNTFTFVVPNTNTTASTLNIDGLGAKALTRDGSTALVAGDLVAGAEVAVVYDGTRFQVLNSNSKTNFNLSGTLTVAGNTTLSGGTANGVAYLNGSKVLTTGSALTFDGTLLSVTGNTKASGYSLIGASALVVGGEKQAIVSATTDTYSAWQQSGGITATFGVNGTGAYSGSFTNQPYVFRTNNTEVARFDTSGNLGIGTASPGAKLDVATASGDCIVRLGNGTSQARFAVDSDGPYIYPLTSGDMSLRVFTPTGSQALTLDSSGNLGLGVTPSAWVSYQKGMDFGGGGNYGSLSSRADFVVLGSNCYLDSSGTTWRYKNTAAASYLAQSGGSYAWFTAPSGTAGTAITFTQAMTLDTSGNLSVGTTAAYNGRVNVVPASTPTTVAGGNQIQIGESSNNTQYRLQLGYINETTAGFVGSIQAYGAGVATTLLLNGAGGKVGIGTVSPAGKLDVSDTNCIVYSTGTAGYGAFYAKASGTNTSYLFMGNATSGEQARISCINGGDLTFSNTASITERMRIDSSGNLLVKATSAGGNGITLTGSTVTPSVGLVGSASTAGNYGFTLYSSGAAANRFLVDYAGNIFATNTTISAISDQRFKENVRDLDVGLAQVLALQPRTFDWKEGKGKDIKGDRGFIAQEFEQVFPNLVDEWPDLAPEGEESYKSVRQDLIPVLVKAMQEQQALIESLTARLNALENK